VRRIDDAHEYVPYMFWTYAHYHFYDFVHFTIWQLKFQITIFFAKRALIIFV